MNVIAAEFLHSREDTLRAGTANDCKDAELQSTSSSRVFPEVETQKVMEAIAQALEDEETKNKRLAEQKADEERARQAEMIAQAELAKLLEKEQDDVILLSEALVGDSGAGFLHVESDDDGGASAVKLRALKDHENTDLSALHVSLDPQTLLLIRS